MLTTSFKPMHPGDRLITLLSEIYDEFRAFQRPAGLDASPLRDAAAPHSQLTSCPLRDLGVESLVEYASAAMTTVGNINDYKHFLPRLLDLAVTSMLVEPEMIALKLILAEWRSWPRRQQRLIEDFYRRACLDAFSRHPDDFIAEGWLCGLAILNLEFDTLIAEIAVSRDGRTALQLAHFVSASSIFDDVPDRRGYWAYVPDDRLQTVRFWAFGQTVAATLNKGRNHVRVEDIWIIDRALDAQKALRAERLH